MLDNNVIQSVSAWPFVEIRKLLKDLVPFFGNTNDNIIPIDKKKYEKSN